MMTPPSARAKKVAAVISEACTHLTQLWMDRTGPCLDCVARALDAEREACVKVLQRGADQASIGARTAIDTREMQIWQIVLKHLHDAAQAIRALAEEEGKA